MFQWFHSNQMKDNSDKCYQFFSTSEKVTMHVQYLNLISSKNEKLLGIEADSNLRFQSQFHNLRKKKEALRFIQ